MLKQNLDILLISPPIFYSQEGGNIWKEVNSNFPPLGLIDIAAYVRSKGFNVKIIDCNVESPSIESFVHFFKTNIVSKYNSIKYIGITSMTMQIKKAYIIAEICKDFFPNTKIVFGGVHATFLTDDVINKKEIDIVVLGEGEITLEEILKDKPLNEINGIVYKKFSNGNYDIIYNNRRERIRNLDELPIPAYDLLKIDKYKPAKGSYKRLPAISMITSRGCPGRCTFCTKTLGKKITFKSAATIFKLIQFLIKMYDIKQIQFYDDTFTSNKKNVIELCDLIINNKIDITWTCFSRVDTIDQEMLKVMKLAGCHQIMYGIETIDEQVLKNIKKKINIEQIINAVKWTKKEKIECRLAFMVGNPGDTKENILNNIRFVNKLNPDYLIVNITTPYPGTEMFEWAKERDLILTYDWDDYDLSKPIMKLENLDENEIKDLYKLMFKKFYFRPKFIFKRILKIRTIRDLKILIEGGNSLISFFRNKFQ